MYVGDFRSDWFSDDKTGSGHFQGIVPNIFIRKSTIARRKKGLSTIFEVLPVLSGFPAIKPEVGLLARQDYFSPDERAKTVPMSYYL